MKLTKPAVLVLSWCYFIPVYVVIIIQADVNCYGKFGCMSILPPFSFSHETRVVAYFPKCPKYLHISFLLWTRENPIKEFVIPSDKVESVRRSFFSGSRQTKIIIHGWFESGKQNWIQELKTKLLEYGDYNVIVINWEKAAHGIYAVVSANTRIVGAILADFIQFLQNNYGIQSHSIHIIGYSLGAHIGGYVGERLNGIGRITGLDPATSTYDYNHPLVRLDPTDALFVDIIYTGLRTDFIDEGERPSAGHVAFYANSGRFQPGCPKTSFRNKRNIDDIIEVVSARLSCHHARSITLFLESFSSRCPYLAYVCDSYDNFVRGKCHQGCGEDNSLCAPVGIRADEWKRFAKPDTTKMFFKTANESSFCQHHYYVKISCDENVEKLWMYGRNKNSLFINLRGSLRQTDFVQIDPVNIQHNSKPWLEFLLSFRYLGDLEEVQLKWLPSDNPLYICRNDTVLETWKHCDQSSFKITESNCDSCPYSIKLLTVINLETYTKTEFVSSDHLEANKITSFKTADMGGT